MATDATTIVKARRYCARQERCQQEVRNKLYGWGAPGRAVEAIIAQLISEGYLNEARFAEHFAVSKFRQKGWGWRRIEQALRLRQVSTPCIALALKAIDEDEYRARLTAAIAHRWERASAGDPFVRRQKLIRYFIAKGFPIGPIEAALNALGAS